MELRELNVLADEDFAVAYRLSRARGTLKNGQEVGRWVRATSCCQRANDTWLIAHEHISNAGRSSEREGGHGAGTATSSGVASAHGPRACATFNGSTTGSPTASSVSPRRSKRRASLPDRRRLATRAAQFFSGRELRADKAIAAAPASSKLARSIAAGRSLRSRHAVPQRDRCGRRRHQRRRPPDRRRCPASPSLYGRGDDERRRAGEASHRDLMLRVAKTWAPGTLRCRGVSASQGTWNGYSSVDVGSAWPENPSNRPSRRLKSRGSPIPSKIPLSRIRTRTDR